LGLLREYSFSESDKVDVDAVRKQIKDRQPVHEKIPTSIDLPLSEECQRILSHTFVESEGLGQPKIETSHLLLGILSEGDCAAARTLKGLGLKLDKVREEIRRSPVKEPGTVQSWNMKNVFPRFVNESTLPAAGVVPDAETAQRIAEAVWTPRLFVVSQDQVVKESATLTGGVWIVKGSQRSGPVAIALTAFIQKGDGKILRLHMEKLES